MFDIETILKFLFAGAIGVTTNFIVTALLKEYFKVNKFYSNSTGLFFALSLNFILNKILTFEINYQNYMKPIISFMTISLISVYINHKIVFFCNQKLKINFYLSKSFSVMILFFWNYTLHSLITFNNNIFQ
jgi:putative flippase GtrA